MFYYERRGRKRYEQGHGGAEGAEEIADRLESKKETGFRGGQENGTEG